MYIGGCRAQTEPRHGWSSTYKTFILWLDIDFFKPWVVKSAGLSPGMPWPAATYAHVHAWGYTHFWLMVNL